MAVLRLSVNPIETLSFLFLPHFDVICDLLLNRRTATWNLFVNFSTTGKQRRVVFHFWSNKMAPRSVKVLISEQENESTKKKTLQNVAVLQQLSATKSSGALGTSMAALGLVIAWVDSHFLTDRLTSNHKQKLLLECPNL